MSVSDGKERLPCGKEDKMQDINEYITKISEDFNDYLSHKNKLCDLKTLNFDSGHVPNYTLHHMQQYYLLRYAYGYCFEYKCMYTELFKKVNLPDTIDILTIGCGTGLDYMGAVMALRDLNKAHYKINYTGVDIVNWFDKIDSRKEDTVNYVLKDIGDYLNVCSTFPYHVITFPKSIRELDSHTMQKISNSFSKSKERFLRLLFTTRTTCQSENNDKERIEYLAKEAHHNGFLILKNSPYYIDNTTKYVNMILHFPTLTKHMIF